MMRKYIIAFMIVLLSTAAQAATKRIYEYTALTTPVAGDYLLLSDTSDSHREKKVALSELFDEAVSGAVDGYFANLHTGDYVYFLSDDTTHWVAVAAGNNTSNLSLKWPTTLPASGTEAIMLDSLGNMTTADVVFGDNTIYTQDSQPAACATGDMWVDTNGTSGQRIYTCESTNTWVAQAGGGGYTNLTSFVAQTPWRIFYSNTDGDVTELALGADGTYLKSNGAAAAPTWATPSGSMVYPGSGIPNSTGSAWGTSYTLDTDLSSTSASDDTLPSAKAVKSLYDSLPSLTWGTGLTDTSNTISVTFGSSSEINTGTEAGKSVSPDALAGSNIGTEPVCWMVKNSSTATAVADGTEAFVVPASMNGRDLIDVTAATASPNGGTGGSTTVVLRRVRTVAGIGDSTSQYDLTFSTPTVTITWDGTGTNPNIANSDASLRAGDEVDITGFATAANNGHWTIASVGTNFITFSNASGVENLNDTGVTITPTKHRNMTSTGVTVAYTEYSASDETVDTGYDDIATGDRIYVDVDGITTTAGAKGLSVTASFRLP